MPEIDQKGQVQHSTKDSSDDKYPIKCCWVLKYSVIKIHTKDCSYNSKYSGHKSSSCKKQLKLDQLVLNISLLQRRKYMRIKDNKTKILLCEGCNYLVVLTSFMLIKSSVSSIYSLSCMAMKIVSKVMLGKPIVLACNLILHA